MEAILVVVAFITGYWTKSLITNKVSARYPELTTSITMSQLRNGCHVRIPDIGGIVFRPITGGFFASVQDDDRKQIWGIRFAPALITIVDESDSDKHSLQDIENVSDKGVDTDSNSEETSV